MIHGQYQYVNRLLGKLKKKQGYANSIHHLAYEHLDASLEKQFPPPDPVNTIDRDQRAENIHKSGDDRGQQRCVILKPDGLKQNRCIKHDSIDPRKLLKHLHHNAND